MTAPEPTRPADEHIDAVARAFSDDRDACGVVAWTNRFVGEQIAKLLLTSTDPAVHAAMLDALVRAGVLTVDLITLSDGYAGRLVTDFGSADLGQSEVAP